MLLSIERERERERMCDKRVIVFVPDLLCSELVDSADGSFVWPPPPPPSNYRQQLAAETLDYFNKHWGEKNKYRDIEEFMRQFIKQQQQQGNTDSGKINLMMMTEDILNKLLDPAAAAAAANGQIIKQFYDLYPLYKTLMDLFASWGFQRGDTSGIIEFGYDWRQSNKVSAQLLNVQLQSVAVLRNVEFIIIAHGMGGLVADWCINKVNAPDLNAKIKKFITLGTPFQGSNDALGAILGVGEALGMNSAQVQKLANGEHVFALGELLPNYPSLYNQHDGSIINLKKVGPQLQQVFNVNWKSIENGASFFNDLYAEPEARMNAPIESIYIIGCSQANLAYAYEYNSGKKTLVKKINNNCGDGTVIHHEALPLFYNTENSRVYYVNGQHMSLATNTGVFDIIKNELRYTWPNKIPRGTVSVDLLAQTVKLKNHDDKRCHMQVVHWRLTKSELTSKIKQLHLYTVWNLEYYTENKELCLESIHNVSFTHGYFIADNKAYIVYWGNHECVENNFEVALKIPLIGVNDNYRPDEMPRFGILVLNDLKVSTERPLVTHFYNYITPLAIL